MSAHRRLPFLLDANAFIFCLIDPSGPSLLVVASVRLALQLRIDENKYTRGGKYSLNVNSLVNADVDFNDYLRGPELTALRLCGTSR